MFDSLPSSTFYRLSGDFVHATSYMFLLLILLWKKNARGISGKTQLLYAFTFTMRYSDLWLFFQLISPYNTVMKVYYIVIAYAIVYIIYALFRESYSRESDSFQLEYILLPVLILSLFVNHSSNFAEILWTYSIYLEALCLVPQFYMIWKSSSYTPSMTIVVYIFLLGLYRALYIVNWVYRYQEERHYDEIAVAAGVVGVAISVVGLLSVISLKIRLWSCSDYSSQPTTIYTLPVVQDEFKKPLLDSKSEKRPLLSQSSFVGDTLSSHGDAISQNSFHVI